MKKVYFLAILVVVTIGLLSVACDTEDQLNDLLGNNSGCTESEANECATEATECVNAVDLSSDTAEQDIDDCEAGWCDCLDDEGCDEWLDEAGCE
jgi:hypothetical protein